MHDGGLTQTTPEQMHTSAFKPACRECLLLGCSIKPPTIPWPGGVAKTIAAGVNAWSIQPGVGRDWSNQVLNVAGPFNQGVGRGWAGGGAPHRSLQINQVTQGVCPISASCYHTLLLMRMWVESPTIPRKLQQWYTVARKRKSYEITGRK
jgi:hypothetical protein